MPEIGVLFGIAAILVVGATIPLVIWRIRRLRRIRWFSRRRLRTDARLKMLDRELEEPPE